MTIPLVLSAISLCLCVSGFFFFRRYIERKTAARELLADYRAEVYRLIAEIDAAADRDSLLVEERIKTLKTILDDTDRRISVYMRELQRSRAGEAMYASLGRGIRAALDSRPVPVEPPVSEEPPIPQKPQLQEPAVSPPPPAAVKRKPKKTKIKVQIAEMSAQGLSPAEIASRLNLSLAEVDLALNLLRR
ncbi:MAG: hypothetical protein LBB89_06765 [Treponema sp.]|jgi:hypothetical protein|nr:hypothetical protein [Treponema sp.]